MPPRTPRAPRRTRINPKDLLERFSIDARNKAIEKLLTKSPEELPQVSREKLELIRALRPGFKRFHGVKVPIYWFPPGLWRTPCSDKFCYLTPKAVRTARLR